jgi:hypothetical protein
MLLLLLLLLLLPPTNLINQFQFNLKPDAQHPIADATAARGRAAPNAPDGKTPPRRKGIPSP